MQWTTGAYEAVTDLLAVLPEGEDGEAFTEDINTAQQAAEEYEQAMDDREYSADNRAEIWGEMVDALENVANTLNPR